MIKKGDALAVGREEIAPVATTKRQGRSEWCAIVPEGEFAIYNKALNAVRPLGLPFLLGGAFGLAALTGRWRNTKDLDLFVMPAHHEIFVGALRNAGFVDYYDTLAYDRGWIYRAVLEGVIVDVIWDTPNRRSQVEESWFERAVHLNFRGEATLAVPPEEMLFIKSFVLQKDRSDWGDLMNLLCFQAAHIDWEHVIKRYGAELPLLRGILNVFAWLCPLEAGQIPEEIRARLRIEISMPENPEETTRARVRMLDTRPWFAAYQPMDKPMSI